MSGPFLPEEDGQPAEEPVTTPWTFRIVVVLAVLYLGWRLIDGVIWLIGRF